jgi:hypothetical protein
MEATVVVAAASGAAAVALFVAMQRRLGHLKPNLFWAQVTFTERQFRAVVEKWGEQGLARFGAHFGLDYCFLVSYGLFGWSLGSWLQSGSGAGAFCQSAALWALPIAAVFDAIENVFHQRFMASPPYSLPGAAFLASGLASSVKWLLSLVFPLAAACVALRNAA